MRKTQHRSIATNLNVLLIGTILALAIGPIMATWFKQRGHSVTSTGADFHLEPLVSAAFLGGIALVLIAIVGPLYRAYQVRESSFLSLERAHRKLEARNRLLAHQVCTDSLLGITNRRGLERLLALEWKRASREKQALSLLFIDVDHFKVYNDSYGHPQGDTCLKRVAQSLEEALGRPGDIVARYGGEEFVILLPNTTLSGGLDVAQRVHDHLSRQAIPFAASPSSALVTVSIGVASIMPGDRDSSRDLIRLADRALYMAKQDGRNRTASLSPPCPVPLSNLGQMASSAPQQANLKHFDHHG
ncbi:GGDEF domain-containing protein [Halomonas sp. ML-15]|uniref:diguanylate cyclase n=1 Tax=Halomonas sp. ML-15 TaxID=2773305 RepID=UPI00174603AF|nr:diguanylate cyclase [Halomonas sp. ML-15]MBD3894713.1 GGDEF domain-containing protein [Halomonas sp. ML-15]